MIRAGWSRGRWCFVVGWIAFTSYPRAARMLKEARLALIEEDKIKRGHHFGYPLENMFCKDDLHLSG